MSQGLYSCEICLELVLEKIPHQRIGRNLQRLDHVNKGLVC